MFYNITARVCSESYIQSDHLGKSSHDTASNDVTQSGIAMIVITAYVASQKTTLLIK